MLVLSRKEGQSVQFPTLGIEIKLLKSGGSSSRLGISAPRSIPVIRQELLDQVDDGLKQLQDSNLDVKKRELIQDHLNAAAEGLNSLHRMVETHEWDKASSTILSVFSQLREIEQVTDAKRTDQASPEISVPGVRALIVEDNRNECELFAAFLRSYGVEADTALDGMEALSLLNSRDTIYDIVLLDMQMPKLDGPGLVEKIRSDPRFDGIKLFAVSGSEASDMNVSVDADGLDRWFSKPVDSNELIAHMFLDLQRQPA